MSHPTAPATTIVAMRTNAVHDSSAKGWASLVTIANGGYYNLCPGASGELEKTDHWNHGRICTV